MHFTAALVAKVPRLSLSFWDEMPLFVVGDAAPGAAAVVGGARGERLVVLGLAGKEAQISNGRNMESPFSLSIYLPNRRRRETDTFSAPSPSSPQWSCSLPAAG